MARNKNAGGDGRDGAYGIQHECFLARVGGDGNQTGSLPHKAFLKTFHLIMVNSRCRQGGLEISGTGDRPAGQLAQAPCCPLVGSQDDIKAAEEFARKARPDLPAPEAAFGHTGIDKCCRYISLPGGL